MIPVDDGKFFVNGSEITLDYRADIPPHLLKHLEECSMTQLDAFYIRKRIYQLSTCIENSTNVMKKRMDKMENTLVTFEKDELHCQAVVVPKIVSEEMHKIVNGKFDRIDASLKSLVQDREQIANDLKIFNDNLLIQITKVAERTIFGAIKKSFDKNPIRTVLGFATAGVLFFVYLMLTLHINSFKEALEMFVKWFSF